MARLRGNGIVTVNVVQGEDTHQFATYVRSIEINLTKEIMEATALKDSYIDRVEGIKDWNATFEKVIDDGQAMPSFATMFNTGGTCTLTFVDDSSGWTYTGDCFIAEVNRRTPDRGAQLEAVRLVGCGSTGLVPTDPS